MKILMSINPKYAKKIVDGTKKYEYRTRFARQKISSIIIYVTAPMKKIIAEVEVLEILKLQPEDLWDKTKEFSGISKEFYNEYFKGRRVAYAYKLGKVKIYEQQKSLTDFGIEYPPQSFIYIR